ncbi:tyrosine-protein phosphatase non-receptor type 9-like [Exaiptasia diaphana]|uniref:CRAL-TRIO domain-containing protein n=1 Tax=Exaiptasia diaphana TaxID=2652724 RepID=A0A913YV90_EXADI|nr:tyrosine-protein phosphatase non-receptor type 9-like [Exaiptasia diaphana]
MVLLYDFTNTSYLTSDSQLCVNIIKLLKDEYPVRLTKTFIISPPFWVESELKFFTTLLRDKNIQIVSRSAIKKHLSLDCIPESLGGTLHVDHKSWIDQCMLGYAEQLGEELIRNPRKHPDRG